jgi:hypothetical protein
LGEPSDKHLQENSQFFFTKPREDSHEVFFSSSKIPVLESESGHVNVRYQYRRTEGKIQETLENYWENAEKPGSCSEATKRVGKLCEFWGARKGWENPGVVILEAVWDI